METLYLQMNLPQIKQLMKKRYTKLSDRDLRTLTSRMEEEHLRRIGTITGLSQYEVKRAIYSFNEEVNFSNFFG